MRAIIASLGLATALALPAMGQEAVPSVPAPSISETEQAQPDWFQQFTLSTNDIESKAWQTEPSQSFSLAWVKGDRWSVSVDLTSRDARSPLPREEMSAGADFRITSRLSVGGEVRIGADELDPTTSWQEQQIEAGIRLRSAFKF
ncbi:MAG: hypothetical protein GYB42_01325 [Alphaproteobacteria bacterium]|nr:hypothetical protein [Alphaproteobacteria bacterium]